MALNNRKLVKIAKTIIKTIINLFEIMRCSIPDNASKNEMRLFKKWAKIGTKMFLDLIYRIETQIPNKIAPKIPPKLWQIPNKMEEIKMAKVKFFNSKLNRLKKMPLNKNSSIIGDKITTAKK